MKERTRGLRRMLSMLCAAVLLVTLLPAQPAAAAEDGGTVLYHQEAPASYSEGQSVWPSNSSTGRLGAYTPYDTRESIDLIEYYNNRSSAGEGLPAGETMTITITDLKLDTAACGEMELSFQYAKFANYVDIAFVGEFRVYASTDGGATWSADCAGLKAQNILSMGTNAAGAEGRLYNVVSTDLAGLVDEGAVINALKIMPYGTYIAQQYYTSIAAISVTGYPGKAPAADGQVEYITVDEDTLRQIVVDHAYQVALTPWYADTEIMTWNGYSTSASAPIQYYKAGRLYKGPTYTRGLDSTLAMWQSALEKDGKYVGGTSDINGSWDVIGWDCINVVAEAWSQITTSKSYHAHTYIWGSEDVPLLGELSNTERVKDAQTVLSQYTKEQVYEAYAQLKMGDHLHGPGHSCLVSVTPNVVRKADGTIDPYASAVGITETAGTIRYYYLTAEGKVVTSEEKDVDAYLAKNPTCTYLYGSSMRVDRVMTFAELCDTWYQPYTLTELQEGRVEKQRITVVTGVTAENVVSGGFVVIPQSNYHINSMTTTLTDSSGAVLYENTKYGQIDEFELSTYDSALNAQLKGLAAGSYKLTVDVTSGPVTKVLGKVPTQRVFELDFTA